MSGIVFGDIVIMALLPIQTSILYVVWQAEGVGTTFMLRIFEKGTIGFPLKSVQKIISFYRLLDLLP